MTDLLQPILRFHPMRPASPVNRGRIVLEITGISVRFGGLQALDDVSLRVGRGEIVGLVGPNGAGKTTLFNAIAGTVQPQHGTLSFDGARLTTTQAWKRARRGIGRAFQIPQPMHGLTVAENIHVAQRFGARRVDRIAQKEILDLVGLADKSERNAATALSLSELKALEVAKALAIAPSLLLLDEVLAGLEAHGKRIFTQLLREVHARYQVAIVIIEHDIETISALCPRVAVLNFGRLIADGPPAEVFRDPAVIESYTGVPAHA